jgi:hypothetical protein
VGRSVLATGAGSTVWFLKTMLRTFNCDIEAKHGLFTKVFAALLFSRFREYVCCLPCRYIQLNNRRSLHPMCCRQTQQHYVSSEC